MLHVHDFDHVKVDALVTDDRVDGVDDDLSEWIRDRWVDLGVKRGAGNMEEQVTINLLLWHLEGIQELKGLSLGFLQTVNEDARMDSLADIALGLAHKLADEEDISCGAITNDIILSCGCTANHRCRWVLNLHLVQQNATILGKLDLASAANEPTQ